MANLTIRKISKALKVHRVSDKHKDDLRLVMHSDISGQILNGFGELIFWFKNEQELEDWCNQYQKPKG